MKLKTLKDIDWYCECENEDCTSKPMLKQEAIKWIKELQDLTFKAPETKTEFEKDINYTSCFIKHFFNFREDDINDKKI